MSKPAITVVRLGMPREFWEVPLHLDLHGGKLIARLHGKISVPALDKKERRGPWQTLLGPV